SHHRHRTRPAEREVVSRPHSAGATHRRHEPRGGCCPPHREQTMNCQDISRIVDTGNFSELTGTQRRAAEAHALTCRHCAPTWAAHSRLSDLRIPAMPEELAASCRTLSAAPARIRSGYRLRRLTVVGGVVA